MRSRYDCPFQPGRFGGRGAQRRGILLLGVIGLLVLVSLLAVTWVVSARHQKAISRSTVRHRRWEQRWQQALDEAFGQVVRGTNNRFSVLRPHSLLEDLYGSDGYGPVQLVPLGGGVPTVSHPRRPNNQPMHDLVAVLVRSPVSLPLSPVPDHYTGCVWTFLDEPAKGRSVRILGYQFDPNTQVGRFLLEGFPEADELIARFASGNPPRIRFVINGRPFNGRGFPFNPQNHVVNFNPQTVGPDTSQGADEDYDIPDFNNWILAGRFWTGKDSRFAPHLQDRWLVLIPSLHRPALVNALADYPQNLGHSPRHKRRWILRPWTPDHPLFRQVNPLLATVLESNTPLSPGTIPGVVDADGDGKLDTVIWDVDNDRDGVPDSIWVDLGFPVARDKKGRLYKPLFAILCLDLDSRLNLSVHGSHTHLESPNLNGAMALPGPVNPNQLPIGLGYGPAAVNLRVLLGPTELGRLLFGDSNPANNLPGRYGLYGENGNASAPPRAGLRGAPDPRFVLANPDLIGSYRHGDADLDEDARVWVTPVGQPQWVFSGPVSSIQTNFTPTDQQGDEVVDHPYQLNPYKQTYRSAGGTSQLLDAPFSVEELELVLRLYDQDTVAHNRRLQRLIPGVFNSGSAYRRGLLTTESYDLPVPAVQLPDHLRRMLLPAQPSDNRGDYPNRFNQNVRQQVTQWLGLDPGTQRHRLFQPSFGQLLALQIIYETNWSSPQQANVRVLNSLRDLTAFELALGRRMNINRLWSNGRDDSPNNQLGFGTVDEPAEQRAGEVLPYSGVPGDWDNDGQITPRDALGRQLYARHLYVLALALKEPNSTLRLNLGGLNPVQQRRAVARRLAQWAVNVVDFRDPDSINTPFFVDLEPFVDNDGDGNTWDAPLPANGQPIPNGFLDQDYDWVDDNRPWLAVVWGAERPELLITETLAWHDFRTEDTDEEQPGNGGQGTTVNDPNDPDEDFDQKRRPQGSTFIELYRPWYDMAPAELRPEQSLGTNAVDLSRLAPPDANNRRYPVWQLVVTPRGDTNYERPWNPQNPPPLFASPRTLDWTDPAQTERIVWFTTDNLYPGNPRLGPQATQNRIYYCRLDRNTTDPENKIGFSTFGNNAAPPDTVRTMFLVGPGQYRIVGSRVMTRIGRSGPGGTRNNLKTIRLLNQNSNVPAPPGQLVSDTPGVQYPTMGTEIKSVWGIPINYPRPFTISEPPLYQNYYPTPNAQTQDPDDPSLVYTDAYNPPLDVPLDLDPNLNQPQEVYTTGFHPDYKGLYLLRLADPLRPYHRTHNPYLVVDYSPIDLSVYNGQAQNPDDDPKDQGGGTRRQNGLIRFGGQERSGEGVRNVWKQLFRDPDQRGPHNFIHSLGFLNGYRRGVGPHRLLAAPGPYNPNGGVWTQNLLQTRFPTIPQAIRDQFIGEPAGGPYPWLPWLDRPFVSPAELLLVPSSPPSRLLAEADYPRRTLQENDYNVNDYPFAGTLGWFAPQTRLHRVLEFLEVPSRFVYAHKMLSPQRATGPTSVPHRFHPPFNFLSRFRDPGRVNLNTAFDQGHVLAALVSDPTYARAQHWSKVLQSLQGAAGNLPVYRQGWPTFFFNPLRAYNAEELRATTSGLSVVPPPADPIADVQRTYLRRDPQQPNRPLFVAAGPGDSPGAGQSGAAFRDANRHPVFRYLPLNKLANTATTRSNVYAVWITMGYFEAIPIPANANYPDGYMIGRELGSDTGEVVRHRAFYIFDRSVPMGFVRGQDLNIEQGVRLRRYIE